MPHSIDVSLSNLIDGLGLDGNEHSLCDFTIADQNVAAESQGVVPSTPSDFQPILGDNITYVVACILINSDNEVLMIQEAKESCAGKWYLPAGRMMKGESIIEATAREVLEETGLECRMTTLLAVETAGGSWYRFVLTGEITGGELKTPARADKESLQAKWVGDFREISLRSNDILQLIERAKSYVNRGGDRMWHHEILPAQLPHTKNMLRLIIIIKKRATNKTHVLLSEKTAIHFPTAEINPAKSVHSTLRRFMVEIFGADVPQHRPHGLLSLEHATPTLTGYDGCCLSLLVAFRAPLEEVPLIGKCVWHEIPDEIGNQLLSKISSKTSTLFLHVVR